MILVLRDVAYCTAKKAILFGICESIQVNGTVVNTSRAKVITVESSSSGKHPHYLGDLYSTGKKYVIIYRRGRRNVSGL